MAKVTQWICDECETVKKKTNHWLDVYVETSEGGIATLCFGPFDEDAEDEHRTVCGQQCATQVLTRWMNTGSLEKITIATEG